MWVEVGARARIMTRAKIGVTRAGATKVDEVALKVSPRIGWGMAAVKEA